MKLSNRMVKDFCEAMNMTKKEFPDFCEASNSGVRVSVRRNRNKEKGQPEGVVITTSTSFWLPFGHQTVFEFLMNDKRRGEWDVLSWQDIGYLDQHYASLDLNLSVLENIQTVVPNWSSIELRRHLNDFLFRKNEEVNCLARNLSGGEKARLSLALIAAKTPRLLILDEITNNLDLETKDHVVQVLKAYPGS